MTSWESKLGTQSNLLQPDHIQKQSDGILSKSLLRRNPKSEILNPKQVLKSKILNQKQIRRGERSKVSNFEIRTSNLI